MSQNPYDAHAGYDDEAVYEDDLGVPQRTSLLAVSSLILAAPCCVPGNGLVAATVGAVSLGMIRNARGALRGRTAAILGIFLGVFATVLQVAIIIGATQGYAFWANTMAPAVNEVIVNAARGDMDAARDALTTDADNDVSDERLAQIVRVIEIDSGEIQSVGVDLGDLFNAFGRVYRGGQAGTTGGGATTGGDVAFAPFVIRCDRGVVLCWAALEIDTSGQSQSVKVVDLLVSLPGGVGVTLREDDEAARMARDLGLDVRSPQELIEAAAGAP